MMMKTAVVIGATGLIGHSLVNQLSECASYQKIITVTRRAVSYTNDKIENHVVDFDNLSQHRALFNADVLFSCLGTTLKQAGSVAAQRVIDYDYQLHAATLASEQGVEHYVLVSSSGADAASNNAYLNMKGELDIAVKQLPFQRISIFKPSLLLGQRDHLRIGEKLAASVLPVLCHLPFLKRYRPIQGATVAAAMVLVSEKTGEGAEEFVLDEIFLENMQG